MIDDNPTDPKENPVGTGHLPVSGEAGVGPITYHDPLTTDTSDDLGAQSDLPADQTVTQDQQNVVVDQLGTKRALPGPDPEHIGDDPAIDNYKGAV